MAVSREEARARHIAETRREQFNETVYGVICAACHSYILIDHNNRPPAASTIPAAKPTARLTYLGSF